MGTGYFFISGYQAVYIGYLSGYPDIQCPSLNPNILKLYQIILHPQTVCIYSMGVKPDAFSYLD
jgi:hypothetical protein